MIDAEFTVKRLAKRGGKLFLMTENDQFSPIEITEEMSFEVWDIVTSVIHRRLNNMTPDRIFALVDCNNFYCSCERVFNPALRGKPVVVLSNNDGCAIARSEEAKKVGIKMSEPFFKIRELVKK